MKIGYMRMILFQQLVKSISISPNGIVSISSIIWCAYQLPTFIVASFDPMLIFLLPTSHSEILLHHACIRCKIRILERKVAVDCLKEENIFAISTVQLCELISARDENKLTWLLKGSFHTRNKTHVMKRFVGALRFKFDNYLKRANFYFCKLH